MKRILYVIDSEESAQFRYRVENVKEVLKDSDKYKVSWVRKEKIFDVDFNRVDLMIILRQTAKSVSMLKFIRDFQVTGKKVLFDLDDLIFDYKDLPILMWSTKSRNIFYWLGYFFGVRRIAKRVDGFLCTNEFLGRKLKKSFNKPYKVIPNSLNKKQVEYSNELIKNKTEKDNFIIGYFSGSPTHAKDFEMIEQELIKFLNTYDDARLNVVGYMNFSDEMNKLIKQNKICFSKPVNYLKLQELMSEVDVNIAPLVINDFTNCKSELKFFEAAAVETTTIASPTYTFKKAIKDGENGFLAQPGEWYDKLEYLYKHPKENKKIAKAARQYALKHYYGKEFLKEVEKAYDFFAK